MVKITYMKKILVVLLIMVSCSKSPPKDCYYCTFGLSPAGEQPPPQTVCLQPSEQIADKQFRDDKGNDLVSYCEKR